MKEKGGRMNQEANDGHLFADPRRRPAREETRIRKRTAGTSRPDSSFLLPPFSF
jgi:hypothetical protein